MVLLKKVANAAQALGMETYLIGGFVRDKLLERETMDADFVCVGDGIELAKEVAKQFSPVPPVDVFKNFGTAHIRLPHSSYNDTVKAPSFGGGLGEFLILNLLEQEKRVTILTQGNLP